MLSGDERVSTVDDFRLKRYEFCMEDVPSLKYDDPEAEKLISNEYYCQRLNVDGSSQLWDSCVKCLKLDCLKSENVLEQIFIGFVPSPTNNHTFYKMPVILTDSGLVSSALSWTPQSLARDIGDGLFTVFSSQNRLFKYYDNKKIKQPSDFQPPTICEDMKFHDFLVRVEHWTEGQPIMYLQQSLNDSVSEKIVKDFVGFNWKWVNGQQRLYKWGPLTSNLLLVGMDGVTTPVHYDEQQNIFAQIYGYKRFLLFSPGMFKCLYPYPVYHHHDRQSQVDLDNPDLDRFPRLGELSGYQAVLAPGDVLYIPIYWWHQVESVPGTGMTISVNFWYKSGPLGEIMYPLKDHQKVAMIRNVEKMVVEALGNEEEVAPLMQAMVLGRYT